MPSYGLIASLVNARLWEFGSLPDDDFSTNDCIGWNECPVVYPHAIGKLLGYPITEFTFYAGPYVLPDVVRFTINRMDPQY